MISFKQCCLCALKVLLKVFERVPQLLSIQRSFRFDVGLNFFSIRKSLKRSGDCLLLASIKPLENSDEKMGKANGKRA